MQTHPPSGSAFAILGEPAVCSKCQSVSRLTNGLCLNCLLQAALAEDETPADKETFKEVLASVNSRDGDWHIAEHEIIHEIARGGMRSEEHTFELQSHSFISYAVFCLKKK